MNIGYNPTFGEDKLSVETHIFDFNKDIYGRKIKINLLKYLRGEKRFSGPEELSSQIGEDIRQAREILAQVREELQLSCEEKYNR
jgi:riboflavin kinase/FMN adenylyltransferase